MALEYIVDRTVQKQDTILRNMNTPDDNRIRDLGFLIPTCCHLHHSSWEFVMVRTRLSCAVYIFDCRPNRQKRTSRIGFRSQYLVLAKDARFQLRQYPMLRTTPRGFEPLRSKTTHLAGEPLNHSGKVSFCLSNLGCPTVLSVYSLEKHKNTNTLNVREFNPGRLRDRQK